MSEQQLVVILASSSVAAAALAFLLKLARDFVADKSRQSASLRIVTVYVRLAVKEWDHEDMDPARGTERRVVNLSTIIEKIREPRREGSELDPFTPYIAFSAHDDLSVSEVRDFLGFLDSTTIESVVDFIQAEALVHALAQDLRSEFVRRQFSQERKIALVELISDRTVYAYDAGRKVLQTLRPYETCPRLLWCLPFGFRIWRLGRAVCQMVLKTSAGCRVRRCS